MLHTLSPAKGSRKPRKRVARGNSAGGGTTAGRGYKGYHSRSGSKKRHGFEGGQTPLLRRQPKLGGFKNPTKVYYEVLNLSDLASLKDGEYKPEDLRKAKLLSTKRPVKVLARGELQNKLTLHVHAASAAARSAVEKAGGSITIL